MRRVVVTTFVSADGVMEAPEDWSTPFWSDETETYKRDEVMASDALLMGRVTYDELAPPGRRCPIRTDSRTR